MYVAATFWIRYEGPMCVFLHLFLFPMRRELHTSAPLASASSSSLTIQRLRVDYRITGRLLVILFLRAIEVSLGTKKDWPKYSSAWTRLRTISLENVSHLPDLLSHFVTSKSPRKSCQLPQSPEIPIIYSLLYYQFPSDYPGQVTRTCFFLFAHPLYSVYKLSRVQS